MENLVSQKLFNNVYHGKKVLITGHSGFKGSWLSLWLQQMGAIVSGISLEPDTNPNHYNLLNLELDNNNLDIRFLEKLTSKINAIQPEIIFHLAAQPLVRYSYNNPIETWTTNVIGTANLLESCRSLSCLKTIVIITTDKCYENKEWAWGYRESDRLGGHDPYSASKAATELVVSSYRKSFFNKHNSPLIATARAGNVIGGGDWSVDRLIPDVYRSIIYNKTLEIRSPLATRPWQHVLESLSGYLLLGQNLLQGKLDFANAWNFGPSNEGNKTVEEVLNEISHTLNTLEWVSTNKENFHEAHFLQLDSTKAQKILEWKPVWDFKQGIEETAKWYKHYIETSKIISDLQLNKFIQNAFSKNLIWTR